MDLSRSSGVFLHLTAAPGPHGIGDLGEGAHAVVEFLDRADQEYWQVCPLGPTAASHGHSPYSARSTFAGNPLFVDLTDLVDRGWLDESELDPPEGANPDAVAYDAVAAFKRDRLRTAFERFDAEPTPDAFDAFREREADWLEDYALYAALKREHDGAPWMDWPDPLRRRESDALAEHRATLAEAIRYHAFVQWVFDEQWRRLAGAAADAEVALMGDVPIYVALDSADVWATREAFAVDERGDVEVVAGVPPNPGDDGQRWGMPVFRWDWLAERDYDWWGRRLERLLALVDVARLDHFKAFDEYWAIPADADSPAAGEWRPGPGADFFETMGERLGELPFVVEDLGFLDDSMLALRDRFGFPGMRVVQYADWCAEHHRYKPSDFPANCVGYTSTHDSNTAAGYYADVDDEQRACLEYALATDGDDVAWDLVEAVWNSEAALAMTTVQDLLGLGSEARFNVPGTAEGNWRWRVRESALSEALADRLAALTRGTMR